MIKVWRLLSVAFVVAVCLGLMLVPAVATPGVNAAGTVGIEVVPSVTEVGYAEDFDVNITITDTVAQDMAAWTVYMTFNTTLMNVTGIDPCTMLPTGKAPDDIPGYPTWDNAAGVIDHQSGTKFGDPYVNSSFVVMTVHCRSNAVAGTAQLNFVAINPLYQTSVLDPDAESVLDWSKVVNGTVKVGLPPAISSVSPDKLTFNATVGENPPARTLKVCNSGNGTLDWSLSDNAGWLSENPTSGSLGADECEDVTVSVDVAGMEAGDYSATIAITGSAGVAVNLHIESATPVGPANLSVSSVTISPPQVKPGEEVTISFNVTNTGGETGSYNATLYINGAVADSQSVSVAPGMTESVIFTVSKSDAGVYNVSVAGQSGQFEVVSAAPSGGGLGTGRMIAIVVIAIALIVALVFGVRRAKQGI